MSYKPILFSSEMVRALLEGRKTQTRRIIKTKYSNTDICWKEDKYGKRLIERQNDAPAPETIVDENGKTMTRHHLVAYREIPRRFAVGDILWVRETWNQYHSGDELKYAYRATDPEFPFSGWKPSIFMPKAACRLFLQITDIRVERLQDISEGDAVAEGVRFTDFGKDRYGQQERGYHVFDVKCPDQCLMTACTAYGNLWEKINGPESWQANPWVWCLTFEKIDKSENFI